MEISKNYQPAFEKALAAFRAADPRVLAARSGVSFETVEGERGRFLVRHFDRSYAVSYPEGTVGERGSSQPVSLFTQLLLLHYLITADGSPLAGSWMAFRQLPGGLVYEAAFRARSLEPLIEVFGCSGETFTAAAVSIGGEPARLGDHSFLFRALPCLPLLGVLWLGDEEMPAEVNILFDASADHYLPTEDLAIIGGVLSGRLRQAAKI